MYIADEKDASTSFGIAVHPQLKASSVQCPGPYSAAYDAIPWAPPQFGEADSHIQMAAFLKDFRVIVMQDPSFSVRQDWPEIEQPGDEDDDDDDTQLAEQDIQKTLREELEERQRRHPPTRPRLMLVHLTDNLGP